MALGGQAYAESRNVWGSSTRPFITSQRLVRTPQLCESVRADADMFNVPAISSCSMAGMVLSHYLLPLDAGLQVARHCSWQECSLRWRRTRFEVQIRSPVRRLDRYMCFMLTIYARQLVKQLHASPGHIICGEHP